MSEYQYYEFQAVDRPLTQEQMGDLRDYSSRAQITPSSFVNVYNWGSFKGNPDKWIEQYFDVFLYLANWGSRWLSRRQLPEGEGCGMRRIVSPKRRIVNLTYVRGRIINLISILAECRLRRSISGPCFSDSLPRGKTLWLGPVDSDL